MHARYSTIICLPSFRRVRTGGTAVAHAQCHGRHIIPLGITRVHVRLLGTISFRCLTRTNTPFASHTLGRALWAREGLVFPGGGCATGTRYIIYQESSRKEIHTCYCLSRSSFIGVAQSTAQAGERRGSTSQDRFPPESYR